MIVTFPALAVAVMPGDKALGRDMGLFVLPLAAITTCFDGFGVWSVFPSTLNWLVLVEFLVVFLIGVILVATTRRVGTEWKATLVCGLCLLLGLAFYFYLPLASMTNPPVNWGHPRTVEGFVHLVTRGQWSRVQPTSDLVDYGKQLVILGEITGRQFGWLYLVFILPVLIFVRRINWHGRRWLVGLIAVYVCTGFVLLALLNPPPDRQAIELVESHFASSFVILAVFFGLSLIMLGAKMTRPRTTSEFAG
jgi:hypothetical protein